MTALLVLAPFVLLLLVAAGWDLATYTIPNLISVLLIASFLLFSFAAGLSGAALASHAAAAAIALVVGFALFAFRYIGGGDAKFFAAASAWIGMHNLLQYALMATLFGGALALVLIAARRLPLPAALAGHGWIARLHETNAGVPYGVALAAGGVAILPYTDVFRFALG